MDVVLKYEREMDFSKLRAFFFYIEMEIIFISIADTTDNSVNKNSIAIYPGSQLIIFRPGRYRFVSVAFAVQSQQEYT